MQYGVRMPAGRVGVVVICLLAGLLVGCDSGGGGSSEADTEEPAREAPSQGVLLDGDSDTRVVDATYDLDVPVDYHEDLVSTAVVDGEPVSYLRTEVSVTVEPRVTVDAFNAILERHEARIVDMLPGRRDLVLRIPDPGDLDALEARRQALEDEEGIEYALKSDLAFNVAEALPGGQASGIAEEIDDDMRQAIDHHLAVRAHAAWNLRGAIRPLEERPELVVLDRFGDGPPDAAFDVDVADIEQFEVDQAHRHGYHVLGIISAAYDPVPGVDPERNLATGMFPDTLRMNAVDVDSKVTRVRLRSRTTSLLEEILADPDRNAILNTSWGGWGGTRRARRWTRDVRGDEYADQVGSGMEHRFLHAASAGNVAADAAPEDARARENSRWNWAALNDMDDYPNLTNVLVAENRRDDGGMPPAAACVSHRSKFGGNISAIGSDVYSIGGECTEESTVMTGAEICVDWPGQSGVSEASGTSMAAPQIAGVAAFAWSVNPDLTVPELKALLKETAYHEQALDLAGSGCQQVDGQNITGQPVIDAYAAVLRAGGTDARRALFDVTGSGSFDEHDIEEIIDAFEAAADEEAESGTTYDFSRYDLSGDGRTGSRRNPEQRFDLSDNGAYGTVSREVPWPLHDGGFSPGDVVTMEYDESSVSDMEILCYYAYSSIYDGDPDARDALLATQCTGGRAILRIENQDTGDPLETVPLFVRQEGSEDGIHFDDYLVEEIGEGEYHVWMPAGTGYTIRPGGSGWSPGASVEVGSVWDYSRQVFDLSFSPPEPSVEVNEPDPAGGIVETGDLDAGAEVRISSTHATMTWTRNGSVVHEDELHQHGTHQVHAPITDICPGGAVELGLTVEDGYGNVVEDSVELNVGEAPFSVSILTGESLEVAHGTVPETGETGWHLPDTLLEGRAAKPSCQDPESERIDQDALEWSLFRIGDLVGTGPTLLVRDSYFRSNDELVSRNLQLAMEYQGEEAGDLRTFTPCYGTLHVHEPDLPGWQFGDYVNLADWEYPDGPVPETSFPPCHTVEHTNSIHDFTEGYYGIPLDELQHVDDYLEAEALLDDLFQDLLADLGNPTPFPKPADWLDDVMAGSWDQDVWIHIHTLNDALYDTTPETFHEELVDLRREAAGSLGEQQYAFYDFVATTIGRHVDMFAPVGLGGDGAWQHIGSCDSRSVFIVDTMAPARGALGAMAEAALIDSGFRNFTEATIAPSVEAAAYGAMMFAVQECQAPQGTR